MTALLSNAARIEISPDMTALDRRGAGGRAIEWPPILSRSASRSTIPPPVAGVDVLSTQYSRAFSTDDAQQLTLLITRAALARLGGAGLLETERSSFYLPSELLVIIIALREMSRPCGKPGDPYRGAKSIELLCETIRLFRQGELHPMVGDATLTSRDTRKGLRGAAHDRRALEREAFLTLDGVSCACGINRAEIDARLPGWCSTAPSFIVIDTSAGLSSIEAALADDGSSGSTGLAATVIRTTRASRGRSEYCHFQACRRWTIVLSGIAA